MTGSEMIIPGANLAHPLRAIESAVVDSVGKTASTTRSLTAALARGDESAFGQFHEEYFDRLYHFLLVLSHGQEHAAQDALQETLVRVARYVRAFDDEEVFWSWLKMVARSTLRDGSRKRRRYLAMLHRFALAWRTVAVAPSPGENLLRAKLSDALEELDPGDRRLIEQKYVAGATTKELALEAGLTERAVESRLLRLRRHLRIKLLKGLKAP